ncbi:N-acetylmuramoyl-L-alanine amidase CwlD [Paenibacillus aurantius]|uniref:N-acetylmuramoyl-L-alanine amidase CwlD n=1 Tax=Paenibacillus aurantius TaxID=2918900 RepID=A0AA96RI36_9BACL|nr:N-acetylmuramoyl-L-alanine amidase CwlD [Paenibacillus aurantius]WNQ11774.1 N-acetylmuramoyl-L-alanine amidase CwlD [Paenibacillus aurantius]
MRKFRGRIVVWMTLHGMMKIAVSALIVGMLVFVYTYELPSAKTWTYWTLPLSGKVIALDAGHGGPDGGAVSREGVIEKDVNLAISLYLRDYLQQAGALVVMTREVDKDLAGDDTKRLSKRKTEDLLSRVDYVNKQKSDLLVSIHLNSFPSAKWNGAQTFYSETNPENSTLAGLIQQEIKRNLENTDRVPKPVDNVYLLKTVTIPSALVEVGFLSNPEEARLLSQTSYQQKVSAAIYQGILKYYAGEKVGTP